MRFYRDNTAELYRDKIGGREPMLKYRSYSVIRRTVFSRKICLSEAS